MPTPLLGIMSYPSGATGMDTCYQVSICKQQPKLDQVFDADDADAAGPGDGMLQGRY